MASSALDEKYMRRALELAEFGRGHVSPNPLVGCVIAYKGRIIGEGWHQKFGGPHAEVHAVQQVANPTLFPHSTAYVTLEPCAHHGKTPPCADLLVKKGLKRVVMAVQDPNPKVDGGGIAKLKAAGIAVEVGVLEAEARAQNRRFWTNQAQKRPYVVLKWAQTADGFIARANGDSKWISNPQARQWVHRWRAEEDAILVGPGTVAQDDPALTVRDWSGEHPTRVVLDRNARLAATHQVFDGSVATRWYTQKSTSDPRPQTENIALAGANFVQAVLEDMHQAGLGSVLVEGGSEILRAFIEANLWDEARIFTAPNTQFGEGYAAPTPGGIVRSHTQVGDNLLQWIENKQTAWQKS